MVAQYTASLQQFTLMWSWTEAGKLKSTKVQTLGELRMRTILLIDGLGYSCVYSVVSR